MLLQMRRILYIDFIEVLDVCHVDAYIQDDLLRFFISDFVPLN